MEMQARPRLSSENNGATQRSFTNPNEHDQPGYFWDRYFVPNVAKGTDRNDSGGVHTNSSLLNVISYKLSEAGMDADDQCYFWMNVALALTPRTDFAQLAEILPWCTKSSGYPQYEDAVRKALEETGYSNRAVPDSAEEGKALLTFTCTLPEKYQNYDPIVILYDLNDNKREIWTWPEGGAGQVTAVVREGNYAMIIMLTSEDEQDTAYYLYSEDGWEEYGLEDLNYKLSVVEPENIIEAGSGERLELEEPEW